MPEISIVLPVYNGERFMEEALYSIKNQTFTDWELIVVDDGSADRTPDIVERYEKEDGRIRLFRNEKNRGLPESLNIGFKRAKGNYLTWTSDDNRYRKDALETMYQVLCKTPGLYMVSADMNLIDENGSDLGVTAEYDEAAVAFENNVGACFLYKREVMETVGGYDNQFSCVEDYDYWLRILSHYGHIERIGRVLYDYRCHGGSLTGTRQKFIKKQLLKLREKYTDFMLAHADFNEKALCRIYYESIEAGCEEQDFLTKLRDRAPFLKNETNVVLPGEKIIIFGAGELGEKAFHSFGSQVGYFVDNDRKKTGKLKCGLKILSIQNVKNLKEEFVIMIAVSVPYIYEIIEQLNEEGIARFLTYQNYRRD